MSKRSNSGMWQYLEAQDVLDKSNAEIKLAKKTYRKEYLTTYKRNHRKRSPEFAVGFSEQNGDYGRVLYMAKTLKMPVTAFIRAAALSYLSRQYILPSSGQVVAFEQALSECLNEVQRIAGKKERYFWDRNDKISAIEKRIAKMEKYIDEIFRHPPLAKDSPIQP